MASRAPMAAREVSKNHSPGAGRDAAAGDPREAPVQAPARVVPLQAPPRVVREYVPSQAAWSARLVRDDAGFEALRETWSALLAEAPDAAVFMSHEWLHAWWSSYRPDAELAIVVAEDRGRARGIAPLMIETTRRGPVSVRTLRFIGDGTGETDHIDFVTAADDRAPCLRVLLNAIDRLDWDLAEFNQIPERSANAQDLQAWLARRRLPSEVDVTPCPVRRLPPSYDELLSTLPGRLRTSIRSSRRKLAQAHRVEFGLHARAEDLPQALESFFANHESRWQDGKGIAGAFSNPRRRAFYARLTPRLLERGWLRFFYLKLDGRPVAQQYCFALDGTVMLLQEGFDYRLAPDNVGNVLRSHVFEHLIATGAERYDFLAGLSRHKQSWSDGSANDLRIRCARRTWKARLLFALPAWNRRLRDALRPWRDRLLPARRDA